jgi:hypothetical protein
MCALYSLNAYLYKTYTYIHSLTHTHIHLHIHTFTYTYIHSLTQTHSLTHTHNHTNTHTYPSFRCPSPRKRRGRYPSAPSTESAPYVLQSPMCRGCVCVCVCWRKVRCVGVCVGMCVCGGGKYACREEYVCGSVCVCQMFEKVKK